MKRNEERGDEEKRREAMREDEEERNREKPRHEEGSLPLDLIDELPTSLEPELKVKRNLQAYSRADKRAIAPNGSINSFGSAHCGTIAARLRLRSNKACSF